MSYHLYCALAGPGPDAPAIPPGVGGEKVCLVGPDRLRLAISRVPEGSLLSDLSGVRAHEQVVACLNRLRTVIPLRYGCRLADDSQVSRLLSERGPRFEALLQELDGCVEMGIRLLAPEGAVSPPGSPAPAGPGNAPPAASPGLEYLKARQAHYHRLEGLSQEQSRQARELEALFAGLFTKAKVEAPKPRLPMLSLYFLVPRPAVEAFRGRFRGCNRAAAARLLLSGPWPPYNFVTGDREDGWPSY